MPVIATDDLFDGARWRGPATVVIEGDRVAAVREGREGSADLRCPALLPGLVDWGVSAVGYSESSIAPHPFEPEEAFARMCLRYGVTTVVDVGNAWAGIAYLGSLARQGRGPRVVAAGGRLATAPSSRQDVLVDAASAVRMAEAQHHAGARLVSIGRVDDPGVLDALTRWAGEAGVPVVLSRQQPRETPGLLYPREEGPLVAPQLEAVARWTVDGLLSAADAAMAAPVLPYARNFTRSIGFVGRRIGRGILGRYYGDRDPALVAGRDGEAAAALAAGTCLASSGAAAAGLVPGRSLWAEVGRLHAAGGDAVAALSAATGMADSVFGSSDVGWVRSGARADLLLLDAPARDADPGTLWELLAEVVIGGMPAPVEEMAKEVEAMVAEAMVPR